MYRLACLLIGYGFGCIQTAYITGRITARIDIREHGSGNAGTSNVIRVIGRAAGIIVFLADFAKAFAAFTVCALLFRGGGTFFPAVTIPPDVRVGLYAGLGAVIGHNFPFFLKFKGGKGIASTLGILLAMDWRIALIVYAVGASVIGITRFISLGSLVMTLLIPVLLGVFGYPVETILIGIALTAMAWILHRGNIGRLLSGTERKLSLRKKKSPGRMGEQCQGTTSPDGQTEATRHV